MFIWACGMDERSIMEEVNWFIFPADTGTVFNSTGSSWPQIFENGEKFAGNAGSAAPWTHAGPFVEMAVSPLASTASGNRRPSRTTLL
jgi:hypothetical protein